MAITLDEVRAGMDTVESSERAGLPFSFHGKASEYFGIWIVNILLSIITLGIYSAWAKVRTKRYFHGNTQLDGNAFSYLATPMQILKGRLIAFAVLVVYSIISGVLPPLGAILAFIFFLFTPWIMLRSLQFNARHTSYRHVRFGFDGRLGEAWMVYVILPILSFFTLGGLLPYNNYRNHRFVAGKARYGDKPFSFDSKIAPYYGLYGVALLIGLIGFVAIGLLAASALSGLATVTDVEGAVADLLAVPATFGVFAAGVLVVLIVQTFLSVKLQNRLLNHSRVGEHRLALDLEVFKVLWIRLTNLVAIVLSVGLLIPWAKIRMARYQIERMRLIPHGDLEAMVKEQQERKSALGDEFGEAMDLDVGLGV